MTEERRAYLREYKRQQRARAREESRCLVCLAPKATKNAVCDGCISRSVEWERAKGWRKKALAVAK